MSSKRRSLLTVGAMAITLGTIFSTSLPGAVATSADPTGPEYVYRVPAPLGERADKLLSTSFDVLEAREGDDLFVLGTGAVARKLREAGFAPTIDQVLTVPGWQAPPKHAEKRTYTQADVDETFYGGYHTLNAHYAHLDQVAQRFPNLATPFKYGESYKKTKGKGGHDLRGICLTKKEAGDCERKTDSRKPKFFVLAEIHARELSAGDTAWRWIDHLTQNYGKDAEVTKILDSTEVWVVPLGNPDGFEIVQQNGDSPLKQRKNANFEAGKDCQSSAYNQAGVDLNRNMGSHWGGAGTSDDPCAQTYKGTSADSEVETKAMQALWKSIYPDKRGPNPTDAAPADTVGMVISLHTYSNLVMHPWGYSNVKAGNDKPLRAIGKELLEIAGPEWKGGQPGEILYNASGSTDDWVYDELGVASYVWEIGAKYGSCGGFLPKYECQDSTHWPTLKPMLTHAAKRSLAPYQQ